MQEDKQSPAQPGKIPAAKPCPGICCSKDLDPIIENNTRKFEISQIKLVFHERWANPQRSSKVISCWVYLFSNNFYSMFAVCGALCSDVNRAALWVCDLCICPWFNIL
jgi:hypothetical protein